MQIIREKCRLKTLREKFLDIYDNFHSPSLRFILMTGSHYWALKLSNRYSNLKPTQELCSGLILSHHEGYMDIASAFGPIKAKWFVLTMWFINFLISFIWTEGLIYQQCKTDFSISGQTLKTWDNGFEHYDLKELDHILYVSTPPTDWFTYEL